MVDKNRLTSYGGPAVVALIVAIAFAVKGMYWIAAGILIIGGFAITLIAPALERKLEERQKRKAAAAPSAPVTPRVSAAREEKGLAESVKKGAIAIYTETRRLIASLGTLTSKEGRKGTVGEEAEAVARKRAEALEELNRLAVLRGTTHTVVTKLIESIQKDMAGLSPMMSKVRTRKDKLAGLENMLTKHISKYHQVLNDIDANEKVAKLQSLEQKLEQAEKENPETALRAEFEKDIQYCMYLRELENKIAMAVTVLQEAIAPDWRDKKYNDMMQQLDRMNSKIKSLAPGVTEMLDIARKIPDRIQAFQTLVRKTRQSELVKKRLEENALAKDAEAKAIVAAKEKHDLEQRLSAAETDNTQLRQSVASLSSQLGDTKALIEKWHKDLETARAELKKNPELDSKFSRVLSANITEMVAPLSTLTMLLTRSEELAASTDRMRELAESGKEQADRINVELEREVARLKDANLTVTTEAAELRDSLSQLKEERNFALEQMRRATEDSVKAQFTQRVKELDEELNRTQQRLTEANTARTDIENDLRTAQGELSAHKDNLATARRRLEELDAQKKIADDELEKTKSLYVALVKELESEVAVLKRKIDELSKDNEKLDSAVKTGDAAIAKLTREVSAAKDRTEELFTKLNSTLSAKGTLEERVHDMQDAAKALEEELSSLDGKHKALAEKHAEKVKETARLKFNLVKLQRMSDAQSRALEENAERRKQNKVRLESHLGRVNQEIKDITKQLADLKAAHDKEVRELKSSHKAEVSELKAVPEKPEKEMSDETAEFIDHLNKALYDRTKEAAALDAELKKLKAEAEKNAKELAMARDTTARTKEELDLASTRHEQAMADLQNVVNLQREDADRLVSEIAELKGRIAEQERNQSALTGALMQMRGEIDAKVAEIETIRAEHRGVAAEKHAIEEKAALLKKEYDLLRQEHEGAVKLRDLVARLEASHRELKHKHDTLKQQIEKEKEAMLFERDQLKTEVTNLADIDSGLQEELLERERRIRELQAVADKTPEFIARIRQLQQELEDTRAQMAVDETFFNDFRADHEKALAKITNLEAQLALVSEAKKDREQQISTESAERMNEFTMLKEELIRLLNEANEIKSSDLDRAAELLDEAQARALEAKKVRVRPADIKEIDEMLSWIGSIHDDLEQFRNADAESAPLVIAIGDVHGDSERLSKLLVRAGVIKGNYEWIADKRTKVVFLGDYIDRGPKSFDVLKIVLHLKRQAGDNLVLLAGNHEAMFLGAFDWVGYDSTGGGRRIYEAYQKKLAEFDAALHDMTMHPTDATREELFEKESQRFPEAFKKDYLRVEMLKMNWFMNDNIDESGEIGRLKSSICTQLGIDTMEAFGDPRKIIDAKYDNFPVRSYIELLRNNLTTHYRETTNNVLFVHAGMPYNVTNGDSFDFDKPRGFTGFIFGSELDNILGRIQAAIKDRALELWMAFMEKSPLFACMPTSRKYEWYKLKQFSDDMILKFGFNAVVHGHSQHVSNEDEMIKKYSDNPRHVYGIDFGLSRHYNFSHGGWLTLFKDGTVQLHVIDDKDDMKVYKYRCR